MAWNSWKTIVATGLLASACTGCSSLPTHTVRGQSPEAQLLLHEQLQDGWKATDSEIQQVRGQHPADLPLHGEVKGVVKNNLYPYEVSRGGYKTPVGQGAYAPGGNIGYASGPNPNRRWGNFDEQPCPSPYYAGFAKYPPNHQELGWDHGGRRHAGQYHYHTYRYKTPSCPVYPAPNQPGGVVTYPYYTHKGPSDFFMK